MPITVFDLIVVLCSVGGLVMVWRSLDLLRHGIVTLQASAGNTEFKLGQFFRLTSTVPALTLFAFGAFFFCLALYYGDKTQDSREKLAAKDVQIQERSSRIRELELSQFWVLGELAANEAGSGFRMSVCVGDASQVSDTFQFHVGPHLKTYRVEIEAPGFQPEHRLFVMSDNLIKPEWQIPVVKDGRVYVGKIEMRRVAQEPKQTKIVVERGQEILLAPPTASSPYLK